MASGKKTPSYNELLGLVQNSGLVSQGNPQGVATTVNYNSNKQVLGRIAEISKTDPAYAQNMLDQYRVRRNDPTSKYYYAYSSTTNNAMDHLKALGFDTSVLNDDWYVNPNNQAYIRGNLKYDGTGNTPSKPGKKDPLDMHYAYWLNQQMMADDKTTKAEAEFEAYQKEIAYYVGCKDRNYSDDEIKALVNKDFKTKYPTLYSMDNSGNSPIELNKVIGYSPDAIDGIIWKCRNNKPDLDIDIAIGYSVIKEGIQWVEDPVIAAKLNPASEDYAPYSVGSTMDKERRYFGVLSFDRQWLDENYERIAASGDDTAKKYYDNVRLAVEFGERCKEQESAMHSQIDEWVANGMSPNWILETLEMNKKKDYKDLYDLDESLTYLSPDRIIQTPGAISYRWQDIVTEVNEKCQKRDDRLSPSQAAINLVNEAFGGELSKARAINLATMSASSLAENAESPVSIPVDEPVDEAPNVPEQPPEQNPEKEPEQVGQPEQPPVFSDAELANDALYSRAIESISNVVHMHGTSKEKAAQLTGRSDLLDLCVESIKNAKITEESFGTKAEDRVIKSYYGSINTVYEYEEKQGLLEQKEKLRSDIDPELTLLRKKATEALAVDELEAHQYQNLQHVSINPDRLYLQMDSGTASQSEIDNFYFQVTGIPAAEEDPATVFSKVKSWCNYLIHNGESPITWEERTRLAELEKYAAAYDKEIEKLNLELDAESAGYNQAKAEALFTQNNYTLADLALASAGAEQKDAGLLRKVEYVTEIGRNPTTHDYYPFNIYDYAVEQNQTTKEQALARASSDRQNCEMSAAVVRSTLEYLDSIGVQMGAEERRNVDSYLREMDYGAKMAGYTALELNDDFEEKAKLGREKFAKEGLAIPNVDNVGGIFTNGKQLHADDARSKAVSAMNEKEADRFFYLYVEEGIDVAKKYIDFLADPDMGVLSARYLYNLDQETRKNANNPNSLSPVFYMVGGIVESMLSAPKSFFEKIKSGISGKPLSPVNIDAYEMRVWSEAALSGSKSAIQDASAAVWGGLIGEDTARKASGYQFDIAVTSTKFAVGSKFMEGMLSLFGAGAGAGGATLLGEGFKLKWLRQAWEVLPSALDAQEAETRSVMLKTNDPFKAAAMGATKLFTSLVGNTFIMSGMHNAYKVDPNALKSTVAQLFGKVIEADAPISVSSWATSTIEHIADKAIMGRDGEWGANYEKYLKQYGSETIAAQCADNDMWQGVTDDVLGAVLNSTVRTIALFGIGKAADFSEKNLPKLRDQIKVLENYYKPPKDQAYTTLGDWGNAPDNLREVIPDDAVINPDVLKGGKGTVMYDRAHGGKAHTIVAMFIGRDGSPVYIDDKGEHVSFSDIAMKDGQPDVGTWVSGENGKLGEREMLSYGYNYAKDQWMPREDSRLWSATDATPQPSDYATNGEQETGITIPESRGLTSSAVPGLPDGAAKNLSIIDTIYDASPSAGRAGVAAVLNTGNNAADDAAAKALVADFSYGDTRVTAMVMQQVASNPDVDQTRINEDIVSAALTNGAGHAALQAVFDKTRNGEKITTDDVKAIQDGVAADRKASPKAFEESKQAAIKESRVADQTIKDLATGDGAKKIKAAEKAAAEAQGKLTSAQDYATDKQNEVVAAADALKSAVAQYDPSKGETAATLEQQRNALKGKITARNQADAALVVQERKAEEAQQAYKETSEEEVGKARATAAAKVDETMGVETDERYAQGIATLPPTRAFDRSIQVFDGDSRPFYITGIYDADDDMTVFTTEDGHLVTERTEIWDKDGRFVGYTDGVDVDDSENMEDEDIDAIMDARDEMFTDSGNWKHPKIRPNVYFQKSFDIEINGKPVHIIGLAGKQKLDNNEDAAVIMDIDGNIYSTEDGNIEIPFDYVDSVYDTFESNESKLEYRDDVPLTQQEEEENAGESEQVPNQETAVPGSGKEGNNGGKLPGSPGRDEGRGDNSDAEPSPGQGETGRSEESETGYYGSQESRNDEVVRRIIKTGLDENKTVTDPELVRGKDYGRFSSSLESSKEKSSYGVFVDSQSAEDLEKNGAITLLSNDGMSGAVVETVGDKKGNIVGVFNNPEGGKKGTLPFLMVHAIAAGGTKLDCYDGFLTDSYESFGFIPVARVPFNEEYAPEGWNYERDDHPDVIVMMHNGDSPKVVARKFKFEEKDGGYHRFTKEEIENLPVIEDYEEALKKRDELLAKQDRTKGVILTHGLKVENAEIAADAGELISPSRAMVSIDEDNGDNIGWGVGDAILYFFGESGDPSKYPTTIYGGDAGTPTMPEDKFEWRDGRWYNKETGEPVTGQDIADDMFANQYADTGSDKKFGSLEEAAKNIGLIGGRGSPFQRQYEPGRAELRAISEAANKATSTNPEIQSVYDKHVAINDAFIHSATYEEARQKLIDQGITVPEEQLQELETAMEVRKAYPNRGYFEEKRRGTVGIKETAIAVLPSNATSTIEKYKNLGIMVIPVDNSGKKSEVRANYLAADKSARDMLKSIIDSRTETDEKGDPIITPKETALAEEPKSGYDSLADTFNLSESSQEGAGNMYTLSSDGEKFGYSLHKEDGTHVIGLDKAFDNDETHKALEEAGFVYNPKSGEWIEQPTDVSETPPGTPPATPPGNPPTPPENGGGSGFGVGPQGEPTGTETGERQFGTKTAQESKALHKQVKTWLAENSEYIKDTNAAQMDRAVSWMEGHRSQDDPSGFHGALAEAESDDFNYMSADGQARMLALMAYAAKNGLVDSEVKIADIYNKQGTQVGQALQARKIFRLMTPAGRKAALKREAERINEEYNRHRSGKKKLDLKVSDEVLNEAANAKSEEEFNAARRKMEKELASQIPSDLALKARTFRMAAMLLNPRTHFRNISGNGTFKYPLKLKNVIGAGLEKAAKVPVGQRTKSLKKSSKDVTDFAEKDAKLMMDTIRGTAKYYEVGAVEAERKAFGTKDTLISRTLGKALQKAADWNSDLLEKEDWMFLGPHYARALAGYMTANGYKPEDMTGKTLDKAREYATQEAQKATYRDFNLAARWFSDQSNKPKAMQFAINAIMPFTKTPMNIVRRGVEYSPIGLVSSLVTARHQLEAYKEWEEGGFKGKQPDNAKSPGEVFDKIAAGMTGTMLAGLGALLSKLGIIKVKPTDAEKKNGAQDYSIEIFGYSIGIGNLPPVSLPILFGASLFEEGEKVKEGETDLWGIFQAIGNMIQPTIETTMFMSWQNLIDTAKYASNDELTTSLLAQKVLANYASSFVPSGLGAIARVVDPTKRKAYTEAGDQGKIWNQLIEQAENKIPFLSMNNVPYLNAWGEEQTNSYFMAFMENFILPDNINKLEDSTLDKMLERISKESGTDVQANMTSEKSVVVNKRNVKLNDKQWHQYSSTKGKIAKPVLQEMIERPEFLALSDSPEVQAELVKKVYKYAKAKAALELFPDKEITDAWTRGALTADNVVDYIFDKEEESAKNASNNEHRDSLYLSIEQGNMEAAMVDIDALRMGGVEDDNIRSSVTKKIKPLYKVAYENHDIDEMYRLEEFLVNLDIGYTKETVRSWYRD